MLSFLPAYELSLLQRLLLIWLFIICGLVLGLQASQHYAENPSKRWFLTQDTKPYWFTFYVFVAFLLVQISHGVLVWKLNGVLGGYEETLLDAVWTALFGLACAMVAGVVVRRVAAAMMPREKVKAQ